MPVIVEPGVIHTPMARSIDDPRPWQYRQEQNIAAVFRWSTRRRSSSPG
jgi:hypothetical protein